jgi:SAM-dependent methyltransferase
MNYDSIEMYRRNKNLVVDGIEGWWLHRLCRKTLRVGARMLGREARPAFTDRLVEYPLIFQHLPGPASRRVLDFGCVEDLLPMHLCALGYRVTGLDFRPYPFRHPNFEFIQADILSWQPPEGTFDVAVSTSTIEHVGLSAYGDPAEPEGDRIALSKLLAAVRPGGRVLFTVPAGKARTIPLLRIYDAERLRALAPNPILVRWFAKMSRYGDWREVGQDDIAGLEYEDDKATGAVQGVAFVIVERPG